MISILHTNDFHGKLANSKLDNLLILRKQADLYFDCGDGIKAGNLGFCIFEDPYWSSLYQLDCTASVLGNRETHLVDALFQTKIKGVQHSLLCANLKDKRGNLILSPYKILECKGYKVGIIGVMVAMVRQNQKTAGLSHYLWSDPIITAREYAQKLRNEVDFLFAITHIGYQNDLKLAALGLFDLVLGGHSHTLIEAPVNVCQTGAHGRFAGLYQFDPLSRKIVESQLISI